MFPRTDSTRRISHHLRRIADDAMPFATRRAANGVLIGDIAAYLRRVADYLDAAGATPAELQRLRADAEPLLAALRPVVYGALPQPPHPQPQPQPAQLQPAQPRQPRRGAQNAQRGAARRALGVLLGAGVGACWGALTGALDAGRVAGRLASNWARHNAQQRWARATAPYIFGAVAYSAGAIIGVPLGALAGAFNGVRDALR